MRCRDSHCGFGQPFLAQPAIPNCGDDCRPDAGDVALVDVVPQAEGIGSGAEREDGPFLHPDRRAHRLHLERIGDGHACESELVAEQAVRTARLSVAGARR